MSNYLYELASLRIHLLHPNHPLQLQTRNANASNLPTREEKMAIRYANTTKYKIYLSWSELY